MAIQKFLMRQLIEVIQDEDDGYLALAAVIAGNHEELNDWIRKRQSLIEQVGKPTEREGRNGA